MQAVWIIIAIFLVCIYVISRIDLLPDVIPIIGWLDDTFLVGLLIYFLRYRKLPGFMYFLQRLFFKKSPGRQDQRYGRTNTGTRGNQQAGGQKQQQGQPKNPYAVLGLKPGASREEIQAAYRELVQKYHPDKLSHLGEEFQEMAQQKFVEIQNAYDQLMGK
ncbi:MAG: DnaJ domain-containing protein [Desulfobacterales bacterium]